MDIAALAKAAAEQSPQSMGSVPIVPHRTLLVDGDGLCYYCAGKDGSDPADARQALLDKVASAARACGAGIIRVLMTASGSPKGSRYAVATVKPYQGQRANSRRPDNWRYLRDFLENYSGSAFTVEVSAEQEADDLWAQHVAKAADPVDDIVLYTQDKDGRHTCCTHLDWVNHTQVRVPPGTWEIVHNDKVYGRKWFWLQMLHGDAADNIPGLPKYGTTNANGEPVFKPVGEVTANNALAECANEAEASEVVFSMYRSFYDKNSWEAAVSEQAQLLWMQRTTDPLDVFKIGAPLEYMPGRGWLPIEVRINAAKELNELARSTQDNAG